MNIIFKIIWKLSKMASKTKLTWKKHKSTKQIYNPESTLVIKSAKEKLVIGRIEGDDFVPLDERAQELAQEVGLEVDPSLVEGDDEEEEDGVESGEEAETQEEVQEVETSTSSPPSAVAPSAVALVEKKVAQNSSEFDTLFNSFREQVNSLLSNQSQDTTRVTELEEQLKQKTEEVDALRKKLTVLQTAFSQLQM